MKNWCFVAGAQTKLSEFSLQTDKMEIMLESRHDKYDSSQHPKRTKLFHSNEKKLSEEVLEYRFHEQNMIKERRSPERQGN